MAATHSNSFTTSALRCERVCSGGCKRTSTSPGSWPLIARGRERVAGVAAKRTFTIPCPWPFNPQVVNELLWVAAKRTFTRRTSTHTIRHEQAPRFHTISLFWVRTAIQRRRGVRREQSNGLCGCDHICIARERAGSVPRAVPRAAERNTWSSFRLCQKNVHQPWPLALYCCCHGGLDLRDRFPFW